MVCPGNETTPLVHSLPMVMMMIIIIMMLIIIFIIDLLIVDKKKTSFSFYFLIRWGGSLAFPIGLADRDAV